MTGNQMKVARSPIMVCLRCPLCCNLVHEATTVSECLHTFCRSCIYQQLGDGENDCCPICNVSLGCSPLEKLRADHQLDDVCAKIFPIKVKRKKDIDNNTDGDAPPPVRRKERSLSSLGIGSAPLSHPGFVNRRTKSVSRRSATIRDMSSDDESEDKKAEKVNVKKVVDRDSQEESSSDGKAASADSEKSQEVEASAKRETVSDDQQDIDEIDVLQTLQRENHALGKKTIVSQEISRVLTSSSNDGDSSKLGMYLAERSKISATGLLRSQISVASNSSERLPSKRHAYSDNEFKPPTVFSGMRERPDKDLINQSPLAQLAEVAVDQAGQTEYVEPPKARGPRARRGRGKNEGAKSSAMGGSLSWQTMLENIRSAAVPQEKQKKPNIPSPVKATSTTSKKISMVRTMGSSVNKRPQNSAVFSKKDKKNAGFWFSLEAAENQFGENALPQISTRFLRIKDGKLPVSTVKMYLVKKLDLQSETEVEITCRGQPVVPNLPLEKVQGIWLATTPLELLPALKELNAASHDNKNWAQFKGRSAEDCMMVLTYARHRRQLV